MKKLIIAAFAAALLTGSIAANAAEKKEMTPEQKAEAKKKALEKYDKNGDGKLDDAEKEVMKADADKKKKKKAE